MSDPGASVGRIEDDVRVRNDRARIDRMADGMFEGTAGPCALARELLALRGRVEALERESIRWIGLEAMADARETTYAMVALSKDDPRIVAWERYRATPDYGVSFRWAQFEEHREGSMWAAFLAGYETAALLREPRESPAAEPDDALASVMNFVPTVHPHADGGFVWTVCPNCGADVAIDEDGCCLGCGRDSLYYGSQGEARPEPGEETT